MFIVNPTQNTKNPLRQSLANALGIAGRKEVANLLSICPAHSQTPLYPLPKLAGLHHVGALHVKDEGQRLGLKSFKALGGAYAVIKLVLAEAEIKFERPVQPHELLSDAVQAVAQAMVVTCATDGNHGKSVAAGARIAGCKSVILVHGGVSVDRINAISACGAEIIRFAGNYDGSVAEATRLAAQNGWTVVSDTSWLGYEDIPLMVMQGYTIMAGETFDALIEPPTHIFVQAGVGGMAAAVAAHAHAVYGEAMPKIIVVEPERAACLFASAKAGRRMPIPHGEPTMMAMLECFEPSGIAWEILAPLAAGFITVPEQAAIDAMRVLALPRPGDPAIVSGESGCAGLAGLLACLGNETARNALDLGPCSRIVMFNSEGATDPILYQHYIGRTPLEVLA